MKARDVRREAAEVAQPAAYEAVKVEVLTLASIVGSAAKRLELLPSALAAFAH